MSKILVVYEVVPESTEFFLVDSNDPEITEVVKKCHGHILNYECDDETQLALETLNLMLGSRTDLDLEEAERIGIDQRLVGILKNCALGEESKKPLEFDTPVTVVHTGFAL